MTGVAHPRAVWGWPETGSLSLSVSLSFSLPSPHPTHRAPSRAPQVFPFHSPARGISALFFYFDGKSEKPNAAQRACGREGAPLAPNPGADLFLPVASCT